MIQSPKAVGIVKEDRPAPKLLGVHDAGGEDMSDDRAAHNGAISSGPAAVIAGGFLLSLLPGTRLKWYGVVLGHYARGAARAARRAAVIPDAAKSVTHKSTDRVNWPIPK